MEDKKCRNCRFYSNGICYNKDFNDSIEIDSVEQNVHSFVESGEMSEMLKEEGVIQDIRDHIINQLTEKELVASSKIKRLSSLDFDTIENLIIACMENIVFDDWLEKAKGIEKYVKPKSDFCCKYWR